MNRKKIGELLLALRGTKTQREVATALGISDAAVRQYESGNRVPKDEIKIVIAEYYGKTVQDIFFD
ncbi:helix-turn-helix transcriptional regulator [Acetobacterium bakii]|uniref:XRE family transcriptional regulator n=1 Tax=Acetobacterium bakii TaxID=52689 RepID=A0A0L6TWF8_9FIRM|nr:helix-turn-helix transcriptional regulator [Acetobacterium bakii]KNZ40392.1 XRE family transcriptional regulator [Acetobacterium bakii]